MWETLLDRMLGTLIRTGSLEVTMPSGRVVGAGPRAPAAALPPATAPANRRRRSA
jgi:hypothetical protein